MPDKKKVIHALKTCISFDDFPCKECDYFGEMDYDCIGTMMKDALILLREQAPVRPRWTHPEAGTDVLMCGSCGVAIPLGKPNYCPWCGKKVLWDD